MMHLRKVEISLNESEVSSLSILARASKMDLEAYVLRVIYSSTGMPPRRLLSKYSSGLKAACSGLKIRR